MPRLTTGLILMLRHRAKNYEQALSESRSNEKLINETRELFLDMVTPDIVRELTNCWLREHEATMRKRRSLSV